MKKLVFCLIIFLAAFSLYANPDYSATETTGLRLDGGIGLTGSIYSNYIYVNPEIMYDLGITSIGGGVNTLFGLSFADIYIAPYAEIELVWFYLDIGAIFELKPAEANENAPNGFVNIEQEYPLTPYVMLGADFIILPIDNGGIGLDLNAGFAPTATPEEDTDNVFAAIFSAVFGSMFNSIKAGASIYYSYTF